MIARTLAPVAALALLAGCGEKPAAKAEAKEAPQRLGELPSLHLADNMSPSDASELMMLDGQAVLLDVRTPEEYAAGHIEGATNIDFQDEDFAGKIAKLPRDRDYILYCRSGRRSASAQDKMEELGFTRVANIEGGITAWRDHGLPTVR